MLFGSRNSAERRSGWTLASVFAEVPASVLGGPKGSGPHFPEFVKAGVPTDRYSRRLVTHDISGLFARKLKRSPSPTLFNPFLDRETKR